MTTPEVNIEAARDGVVAALTGWAQRRDRLPEDRGELVAIAWHCGLRNVAVLARAADVSRDTIYADLRARGVDVAEREQPSVPHYLPLHASIVRQAADAAAAAMRGAMLAEQPEPLANAGWQASIGLQRIAEALAADGDDELLEALRDLADRADEVRQYANRALAEAFTDEQVAGAIEREMISAYCVGEPIGGGGTVVALLPDSDRQVTVRFSSDQPTGWTTLQVQDGVMPLPPVGAYLHVEIVTALNTLARLVAAAGPPAVA